MLAFAAFLLLFAEEGGLKVEEALKSFMNVFAAAEEHAADPINPNSAVFEGAIPGMLRRLDPFSVFFDPGQSSSSRNSRNRHARALAASCRCCRGASSSFKPCQGLLLRARA